MFFIETRIIYGVARANLISFFDRPVQKNIKKNPWKLWNRWKKNTIRRVFPFLPVIITVFFFFLYFIRLAKV